MGESEIVAWKVKVRGSGGMTGKKSDRVVVWDGEMVENKDEAGGFRNRWCCRHYQRLCGPCRTFMCLCRSGWPFIVCADPNCPADIVNESPKGWRKYLLGVCPAFIFPLFPPPPDCILTFPLYLLYSADANNRLLIPWQNLKYLCTAELIKLSKFISITSSSEMGFFWSIINVEYLIHKSECEVLIFPSG